MSTSSTPGCSSSTKKFRVAFNEELGRHLVASEDILPGEIIIKEFPLVRGPCIDAKELNEITYENSVKNQEDFKLVCVQCFRSYCSQNGYKCRDCNLNLFCSTVCSAGIGHIYECEFFRKSKSHVVLLPLKQLYCLISVLRCLSLRTQDPKKWEQIVQLQSKVTNLLEVGALKWLDQIFAPEYPSQRNYDEIIKENNLEVMRPIDAARHSFGVMRMNAFSDLNQSMGYEGLYFLSSLMAHSCVMNTDRHFTPSGEMVVKAAVLIRKGENITTTYLPLLSNTEQRHEEMKKSWFFQCICPRCQDAEELGTHLSTVLPEGIHDGQEIVKIIKSTSPKSQDVSEIEMWLQKFDCSRWLHPNHSLFLQLKLYLCLSYGRQEGGIAGLSDDTLTRKYQLCKQLRTVYDIIYPGIFQCKGELLFEMWVTLQEMKLRNLQVDEDGDEHSLVQAAYQILKHASPSTSYKKMCDILEDEIPGFQQLNT